MHEPVIISSESIQQMDSPEQNNNERNSVARLHEFP